ncbi:MAG: hypothetical protein HIU85_12280 [Proteobacteria bacterium]|nr:hypothetical protein [Pseudomonadota bacterium]
MQRSDDVLAGEAGAEDGWHRTQAGFRSDWSRLGDSAMIEGGIYNGTERQLGPPMSTSSAAACWRGGAGAGTVAIRFMCGNTFDHSTRGVRGAGGDDLNVYDLTAQEVSPLARQQILWPGPFFDPASRPLAPENLIAQDTWTAADALKVAPGMLDVRWRFE